jgi:hypothetical protein
MMGHDGLLKAGELASGLTEENLEWNGRKDRFYMAFERGKACHLLAGKVIPFVDYGPESAVSLMRKWLAMRRAYKYKGPLFPRISADNRWGPKSISTYHVRNMIKKTANATGLDSRLLSGHSLRAGGATDLFEKKVPFETVKKIGRWRSDEAMLYYIYEDPKGEIWKAFARC